MWQWKKKPQHIEFVGFSHGCSHPFCSTFFKEAAEKAVQRLQQLPQVAVFVDEISIAPTISSCEELADVKCRKNTRFCIS
jgi:hypothetical protein